MFQRQRHAHRLILFDLVDAKYEYQTADLRLPNGKMEKAGSQNGTFMLATATTGAGEVDLEAIMRIVKSAGYKGWINVDHHCDGVSGCAIRRRHRSHR